MGTSAQLGNSDLIDTAECLAKKVSGLVYGISKQAITPPGRDPVIGAFYSSIHKMYVHEDPRVRDLLNWVCEKRPTATPAHLAKIVWGAFHAVMTETCDEYPYGYDSNDSWETSIEHLLDDKALKRRILEILLKKDTTTTVYQRYITARYLIPRLMNSPKIRIADFGCGANYGLPGLTIGEPFTPVVDHTTNRLFSDPPGKLPEIEGYSVDKTSPYTSDFREWIRQCGRYPREMLKGGNFSEERLSSFENRLRSANGKVQFIQADLSEDLGPTIPKGSIDFVLIMTMLYQHRKSVHDVIISNARRVLSHEGVIIVQDFLEIDSTGEGFVTSDENPDKSNFGENGAYRTFILSRSTNFRPIEVLRWDGGRCGEVYDGSDYNVFTSLRRR